ncbi:MAG: FKBP-type peptidyl-prolyl cis-trans isomerase [Bacteroidota bacterium]
MKKFTGWLIGFSALVLVGCNDDTEDNSGQDGTQLLEQQQQEIETYLADNGINAIQEGNIYYQVLTENPSGDSLTSGDIIRIYYQIAVLDGAVIDERLADSGEPPVTYRFTLSTNLLENNLVLPVLDFSIATMQTGEEYEFYLPSAFAYVTYSLENVVPENAIIRARVQLVEIVTEDQLGTEEDQEIKNYLANNGLTEADSLTNGVYYIRTEEGEADGIAVENGRIVQVRYTGTLLDGTEFDSNTGSDDDLLRFTAGNSGLITGFDIGVSQMKQGEKGTVVIPSLAAYDQSQLAFPTEILLDLFQRRVINSPIGVEIPPFTPLRFDIEVVTVN